MIKDEKKDKKAGKIPFGRLGGRCSVCKKKEAIIASDKQPQVLFGDGMAGMPQITIEAEPPFICRFCGTPFKAKERFWLSRSLAGSLRVKNLYKRKGGTL